MHVPYSKFFTKASSPPGNSAFLKSYSLLNLNLNLVSCDNPLTLKIISQCPLKLKKNSF